MKKSAFALLAAVALSVVVSAPQAIGALLLPAPVSSGFLAPAVPPPGGAPLAVLVSPFADGNGKFSGVLTTTVFAGGALGGLTFEYNLANNPNSIDPLTRMTVIGWATSPLAAADNGFGTPGVLADYADRISGASNGDTIGFTWGSVFGPFFTDIKAGQNATVYLYTPLKNFAKNNAQVIDGGVAIADTFAPVPEPTTVLAGIGALGLLLGVGLRKRNS